MVKIDKYDQKILFELDANSRTPASKIAKKVRLSKVAVNNRIKNLVKKGIIKDFITQIDYRKLGYNVYHVYFKFQNISLKKEEEFFNFLLSKPNIVYIARIDGSFDVFSVVMVKDNEDLDQIIIEINQRFGEFIRERNVLIILNALYFGRRYLTGLKEKKIIGPIIRKKPEKIIELDNIDNNLLKILSNNARLTVIELMKKLNLTKDIIHYRLKKLIKENIIQKFTINLNNEVYGNSFFKLIIKFNYKTNEKDFISKISQNINLIRVIRLLGNFDLELDFEVKDNKEMRIIIKNIKEKFGDFIQHYDLLFIYQIDKLNYYPGG